MGVGTLFLIVFFLITVGKYLWDFGTKIVSYQRQRIIEDINEKSADKKTADLVNDLGKSVSEIRMDIENIKTRLDMNESNIKRYIDDIDKKISSLESTVNYWTKMG